MAKVIDPFSQGPVMIKMLFGSTELAIGTAFFYRRNGGLYLVSNWHNLSGRNPITKQPLSSHGGLPDRLSCYLLLNRPHIMRAWVDLDLSTDGKLMWLEHPTQGSDIDVAALPVTLRDEYLPFVFNEFDYVQMTLRVSHDVFVLGYPMGIMEEHGLPIWKRASVASEPGTSASHFYIDTATRSGMSGSPVLFRYRGYYKSDFTATEPSRDDWMGEGDMFAGVYSGRLGASELEAQLGIVWKTRVIDEIIDGNKCAEM